MYKYRKENMQNKTTNSTPEMVREGVVVKFDFKPIKLFRILKGFLPCSMQNFDSNTSCPTLKILQKKTNFILGLLYACLNEWKTV